MSEKELFDKLDEYISGSLNDSEKTEIEAFWNSDPVLKQKAEEHLRLLSDVKFYGRRRGLRKTLHEIHSSVPVESSEQKLPLISHRTNSWSKYWPLTAVAASVALISTFVTLYLTQSLEQEQTAYYKELVRKVEQIKKSQNLIMADIAESKEKSTPTPANYTGTGFLISSSGYIATSYHVIKNADSIYIENQKIGTVKAAVLFSDAASDVSILKILPEKLIPLGSLPYTISTKEASLGEDVFTLGFPRDEIVFGEGSISASTGYRQDSNAYQISVPVNPGNSGGPLFNVRGDVVGIISGLQTETSGTAFATKASALLNTIEVAPDSLSETLSLPRINTLKNLTKIQQLAKWKDYVFMIRVYSSPTNK